MNRHVVKSQVRPPLALGADAQRPRHLLEPRSIAIIGASPDKGRFGGRPLANLQLHDFAGRIYPVNPKYDDVDGLRCYPSITSVDGDVDAVLFAIPADQIPDALRDCGAKNVSLAVVISSGFAEIGSTGAETQGCIVAAARESGIRVLGPNCLGFINVHDRIPAVATSAVELPELLPGPISMVSQSGALGIVSVFVRAFDHGVGFRYVVSSGNEADLHALELMRMFVDDPHTRVVAGLIEQFREPEELAIVAQAALAAQKPVVVLKVGRSEGGTRAASAHTAALAGSDAAHDAAFHTHGVIRVDDLDELWQVPDLLANVSLPRGRSAAVMTTSGGLNGLMADLLHREGIEVPTLSPQTITELKRVLPSYSAPPNNPLDMTGGFGGGDKEIAAFSTALRLLDDDAQIDLIVLGQIAVRKDHGETLEPIVEVVKSLQKPVVVLSPGGSISEPGLRPLHRSGIPLFTSPQRCARALGHLCRYAQHVATHEEGLTNKRRSFKRGEVASVPPNHVDAAATERLLEAYGIPLAVRQRCSTPDEALAAAERIGYPVVLKAVGLMHKTEAGGVVVGIRNADELASAYADLRSRVAEPSIDVQAMIEGGVEMIVGIQHDEHFGAVVAVGFGGIFVEVLGDSALRLPPIGEKQAREMIGSLRAARVLEGFRGSQPCDIKALIEVVTAVSELASDLNGSIESLDLNPVIVLPAGHGARVVDATLVGRRNSE
jgi:acetate---CoA ligase (ADP-forming)